MQKTCAPVRGVHQNYRGRAPCVVIEYCVSVFISGVPIGDKTVHTREQNCRSKLARVPTRVATAAMAVYATSPENHVETFTSIS